MRRPRRRPRETAESIAVPSFDIVEECCEAIGEAVGRFLANHTVGAPPPPPPRRRFPVPTALPQQGPTPLRRHIYIYPWISGHMPWGAGADSPCGEGSEDTAVPPIDPAEVRLCPDADRLAFAPGEIPLGEVRLTEEDMMAILRERARARRA
jgi:hypothetical protein